MNNSCSCYKVLLRLFANCKILYYINLSSRRYAYVGSYADMAHTWEIFAYKNASIDKIYPDSLASLLSCCHALIMDYNCCVSAMRPGISRVMGQLCTAGSRFQKRNGRSTILVLATLDAKTRPGRYRSSSPSVATEDKRYEDAKTRKSADAKHRMHHDVECIAVIKIRNVSRK